MSETRWTVPAEQLNLATPGETIWLEESEKFTKVIFRGKEHPAESVEALLLGGRKCPGCSTVLPPNFAHCPNCGVRTETGFSGPQHICHWPSYQANGWAELGHMKIVGLDERNEIRIPGGDWGLAVAGSPAVLVAYDHEYGRIVRYDGDSGWADVTRTSPSNLKPWQRSLVASQWGLFFATETDGMGFLPTPFIVGAKAVTSSSKLGAATPVGGPAVSFGSVRMPVVAEGRLRLDASSVGISPARDASAWHSDEVANAEQAGKAEFGAPFTNEASDVFWSSEHFYIALTSNGDGPHARLLPWRKGFTALPVSRPFRSRRGGGAWQLGRYTPPDNMEPEFAFHLVTPSASRQELRTVSGPHLPYGPGTFRGDKRHDDPWSEPIADYYPGSDDNVIVPLCTFGEGEDMQYVVTVLEGREKLSDLIIDSDITSAADARFHLLGRRQGNIFDMRAVIKLQSIHDVSSVVFGDRLFVYAGYDNQVLTWRILT